MAHVAGANAPVSANSNSDSNLNSNSTSTSTSSLTPASTAITTGIANAGAPAAANADRRRVKVYELKNNDWYDRGTGFCSGQLLSPPQAAPENLDARMLVVSEDDPNRTLLETCITKEDGYQKQQETLIVWTESNGVDMALSFQEAEGCASIWKFVSDMQRRLAPMTPELAPSDDLLDPVHPIVLPDPQLGRLEEVEDIIRTASTNPAGRDALARFVMHPEQMYILKLAPLVTQAEEAQSAPDLNKLCTIMKHLILLNDTSIIEFVVTDQAVMGVVGALEYDPDFPSHRANHRQYLSDSSKFKEVVPIEDPDIRRKIHWTYRLLYLKDVVLARILDDPTFSVLNSLIFFHQVDIVNHIQSNALFLKELFAIFGEEERDAVRKKEAVLFIQHCCAVSKSIQTQSRAQLYQNFIVHGLFTVITFALKHHDASVRVAGTDVLVALIDHDAHMVRSHMFAAIKENRVPLTDTLIELLLVEADLGVKSQMADAIKILLDPTSSAAGMEMNRAANSEIVAKQRGGGGGGAAAAFHPNNQNVQTSHFIDNFYESSATRLFAPLKALEKRDSVANLTIQETSLFTHLVEVLSFFVRQHSFKSKLFILSENLHSRVAQLLDCSQKYMKLTALKWFRTCVGLQDEFHNRQMIQNNLLEPILRVVEETMPRDNLLNSACLELFEYIKREGVKQLITHLVEGYRDRLTAISYVNTFQALVLKYDQMNAPDADVNGADEGSFTTQEGTPHPTINGRQSFAGLQEMDGDEEAYFNTVDDEVEDDDEDLPTAAGKHTFLNGASPARPLVNYPDDDDDEDDEEEGTDILASSPDASREKKLRSSSSDDQRMRTDSASGDSTTERIDDPVEAERGRNRNRTPVPLGNSSGERRGLLEPLAIKRRREDEDDDELGKMMGGVKRRNSSTSLNNAKGGLNQQMDGASPASTRSSVEGDENGGTSTITQNQPHAPSPGHAHGNTHVLRRKGHLRTKNESSAGLGKLSIKHIALSPASKSTTSQQQQQHQQKRKQASTGEGKDASNGGKGDNG